MRKNWTFSFIAEFRFSGSLIFDRKALGVFTILLKQSEESNLPNAENLLNIFSFDSMFEVPFQKVFNLLISKFFVHLNHSLEPPFLVQGYNISDVHFSSLNDTKKKMLDKKNFSCYLNSIERSLEYSSKTILSKVL